MRQVVEKISLYVEEKGAGDPSIVFLHYWGGTHRTWNKVVAELAGSHRTITYDMRGWGQSEPAATSYCPGLNEPAKRVHAVSPARCQVDGEAHHGKPPVRQWTSA